MPATDHWDSPHPGDPDLADPEFAPLRARLARAFLDHKADLGIAHDQQIVDHVDDVTAILVGLVRRAMRTDDREWMARFGWFAEVVEALSNDEPRQPLDG